MTTKRPERVSVFAAAGLLGITPRAVRYAITRGQIAAQMIGSVYAIPTVEVTRYAARVRTQSNRQGGATPRSGSCGGRGAHRSAGGSRRPAR